MRVLQINSVCGIGSTGRIATDIHAILEEQGHESYIAYGRNNPMKCDTAIRIGNKLDNYAHVAKTRILDMHGFGSKKATKNFIDRISVLDPDIIHLHNIHGYYINIEILFEYLKKVQKPVIWTLHDCWAFTGHCTHFEYIGCECWKIEGNHKCIQKRSYPSSLLINNSTHNYERKKEAFTGVKNLTIITPSKWLAGYVKESSLSDYKIKVINNGIDLKVFKPTDSDFRKRLNLENKTIILGVSSVWNKTKGLETFIEMSRKLDDRYKIVLVGLTPKQQKLINKKNIIGLPKTNNINELCKIYSTADIFVNPTLEDTFPTTNLEAIACGTPVITYNTGGSVESINEECGAIVEKNNVEQLIRTIDSVRNLKQKKPFEQSKKFDNRDRFTDYINLYKTLV